MTSPWWYLHSGYLNISHCHRQSFFNKTEITMRFFSFCFIRNPASPHMGVFSRTNPTAAFNYVISQIASSDVTASTQALVQFERVIRNKNHKEVSKHIDQVRCIWLADGCMCVVKWRLASLFVCGNWPRIITFLLDGCVRTLIPGGFSFAVFSLFPQ